MTQAQAGLGLPAESAAPAVALVAPRDSRWNEAARVLFLLAAIGSVSSPPVANICAFLGLLAFAASPHAWLRLRAAARRPLGRGILLLLGTLALAMLWADDAPWGRRFASWWSWRPLILVLVGSALFDTAGAKDCFARAFVAALALAAVASIVLRLSPHPILIDDPGILLRNHTTQGMAFVVGAALAAMLAWGRPAGRRERWLLIVALALFVGNIATITTGRSAHIALLVVIAAGAFARLGGARRWLALIALPVLAAGLLAASPLVRERFELVYSEVGTAENSPVATSSGIRLYVWSTTRELIARRPWFGYGMGGFVPAYAKLIQEHVVDSANWRDAARAQDTHNEYLHVLVEAGVPGLLAFLFYIFSVLREPAPPPYRACGLAIFLAWLATSLFNSHFQSFAEAHLLGLVLGVLLARDAQPAAWTRYVAASEDPASKIPASAATAA
jgi:O-antigen ligase